LGWFTGSVPKLGGRTGIAQDCPYRCRNPAFLDASCVVAVHPGVPRADPRAWESHPTTRPSYLELFGSPHPFQTGAFRHRRSARLGRSGAQHLSQFDFVTFTRSALFVARPLTLPGHAPWRRCHLYPLRPRVHHTGARPTPSIFHRSHVRHTGARPTSSFWIRYGTCQGPPLITPLVSGSPSPVRP
jgi:hypothetical protein